jgi:hypothetical protein
MFLEPAYARLELGCMRGRSAGAVVTVGLVVIGLNAIACGSASQSVTAPGGLKCAVSASAETTSFGAAGGNGTVRIATNRECGWSLSSSGSWIQLNGSRGGQGDAQVGFTVSANAAPAARTGAIMVGDQQVSISQAAGACTFGVSPLSAKVASGGDRRTIDVSASSPQCAWTARSEREWLVVVEGASGTGSGKVVYEARSTAGPTRAGTIIVAGQSVTITQGSGCSTALSPSAHSIGASGGAGAVSVAAGPGCAWTASGDVPWISITAGASGSGPGTIGFSVGAWNGPTRGGAIRVGDQVVTVTQTAGCSFSISPHEQSVPAAGGSGTVSVSTVDGCAWSASSQSAWISIVSGAGGSGAGQVSFDVLANSGPARNGTLTIAGQAFTVRQSSGCALTIQPQSQSFGPEEASGTIDVGGGTGCAWTADSSQGWVRVTSGASGSGSGTVRFTVERNDGAARSASILVAGHVFAVQQGAAACSYSLDSSGSTFGPEGGTSSIRLTTGPACQWTAMPSEPWVELTSPASGTGAATVGFKVGANKEAARSATLTIAGVVHTISQAGAACSYSIDPTGQSFVSAGGTGAVTVNTAPACEWTAQEPSEDWVALTSPDRGAGPGSVSFSVQQNMGPDRTATITVAGQLFGVQQSNGCTFALSAPGQDFAADGGTGSFSLDAADGCAWAAVSGAEWITITAGGSGSGDGIIEFSVAANPGDARSGVIAVGGQTFTVTQRAPGNL